MTRFLYVLVTLFTLLAGCDGLPDPVQYSPPEVGEFVITNPADLAKHVGETVIIRGKLERAKLPSVLSVELSFNDIPSVELFGNQVECKGKLQKEVVTHAAPEQQRVDGIYYSLMAVSEDKPVTVTLIK